MASEPRLVLPRRRPALEALQQPARAHQPHRHASQRFVVREQPAQRLGGGVPCGGQLALCATQSWWLARVELLDERARRWRVVGLGAAAASAARSQGDRGHGFGTEGFGYDLFRPRSDLYVCM